MTQIDYKAPKNSDQNQNQNNKKHEIEYQEPRDLLLKVKDINKRGLYIDKRLIFKEK